MKKLFLLLLFVTGFLQAQTLPSPSYNLTTTNTLKVKTNTESVTGTNKIPVQETDGIVNYIQSINIPVPYIPTNYSPTTQTLKGQLEGINTKLGAAQTTAGQTARVNFTADNVTVNSIVYFPSSTTGKGTATAGSPPTLSLGDNVKAFFTKDIISILQPSLVQYPAGTYAGQLTVSATPTPNATQQRFTIEIYKTDSNGVAIASGVAGAPIGSLGVAVITILDSGIINLTAGAISNVSVSGQLLAQLTINPNERIKYHVSAQKVGTGGGNVTMQVYYGSNYNSYYDIPIPITTDGVLNKSTVTPAITNTDALNWLNTNKENAANKAIDFSTVNNTLYPTVQAAKTYADGLLVGLWNDRGNYTIVGNAYPTTGGSGTGGAIIKGNAWQITGLGAGISGTIGTKTVNDGDVIRALINSPGNTDANWAISENNIGFTPANDDNVLHKTGNLTELVNGSKTFEETTFFNQAIRFGVDSYIDNFNRPSIGSQSGDLLLYSNRITDNRALRLKTSLLTNTRSIEVPDKNGVFALTSDITGFANDANVVHRTGNLAESINGFKTFDSGIGLGIGGICLLVDYTGSSTGFSFPFIVRRNGLLTLSGSSSAGTNRFSSKLDNRLLLSTDRTFSFPDKDGIFAMTSDLPVNPITGTGTANYIPKFTAGGVLGNSNIQIEASGNIAVSGTISTTGVVMNTGSNVDTVFNNLPVFSQISTSTDSIDIGFGTGFSILESFKQASNDGGMQRVTYTTGTPKGKMYVRVKDAGTWTAWTEK